MQHIGITDYPQEDKKEKNYILMRYTLLESLIIFIALLFTAMIFTKLNSVALPVSTTNGNVISFEATQSVTMLDLLGAIVVIAICTTTITTLVRKRFRNTRD
jgi:small-conductance mechanosensitive channel